ncbi:uncharacterized protein LOC105233074 isoform X1 [Bactrocera dorsalis]|uniref:Uncharacterized protein LOC105233074 isoform X1 n=1 Tax=Bactrocera dorsalis TaxID=27457 RepID=A0ABM3JI16_BACDO|nr:uncharacterized protein LOC105233074 isoform X1 [Bactrocera dorsalis]
MTYNGRWHERSHLFLETSYLNMSICSNPRLHSYKNRRELQSLRCVSPTQEIRRKIETSQRCLNHSACDYALSDPVLIVITLTAVVGSFCLLSGLIILCAVSKTLHDQTSEAILLLGIGFFIYAIAFVAWKITNARRIAHIIEALNKETTSALV